MPIILRGAAIVAQKKSKLAALPAPQPLIFAIFGRKRREADNTCKAQHRTEASTRKDCGFDQWEIGG